MSKDFRGFKFALQLRGENLKRKDVQSDAVSPYFVIRRAHGKVKTDKGLEEAAIIPDANYKGNDDMASIVYNGNAIRAENTANPKWPKFEVDIESLCENGELNKKLVFDFIDNSSNEFLGFLSVSVQDLLISNHFVISGSSRVQGMSSKIVVEHANLVPPSRFNQSDTEAASKICGVILHQISTGEMIDFSPTGMSEADIACKSAEGWAYYDSVADEKGNLALTAFNKIMSECIQPLALKVQSNAIDVLEEVIKQILAAVNPSFPDFSMSQFKSQDSQKLSESIEKAFPLLAKALFSFFDADGNGTISKDEVIACIIFFKQFTARMIYNDMGFKETLLPVVDSLFRVFDSNGNGIIEAFELQDILADLVAGTATVLLVVLDVVRTFVEAEILTNVVETLCDGIKLSIGAEWPLPTEDIVAICLKSYSDPSPASIDTLKSLVSGKISWFPSDYPVDVFDFAQFFEKFEAEAIDGVVKKQKCVEIATACIKFPNLEKAENEFSAQVDQRVAYVNAVLANIVKMIMFEPRSHIRIELKTELIQELVSSCMINLQAYVRSGGARKFIEASLNLLDLNSDGLMSHFEIRNFYDSLKEVTENGVDSELKAKTINAASAFLSMMDSNSDRKLDRDEIFAFCKKILDACCEYYTFLVNSAKTIIKGTIPSIVGVLFDIKTQLVGGDASLLSKDEVFAAFAKQEEAAYPSRTQLHWEALRGNASIVAALVSKGGLDLNARDEDGYTPLHLAAQYSHRAAVLELINSKANVGVRSNVTNQSALSLAEQTSIAWKSTTRMWEHELVKEILKRHGCDGWTPLMVEAEKGDTAALQGLVSQRVDVGARNAMGASALHHAASPAVVQILLDARADLNARDERGHTPLHYAAAYGRIPVIEFLLDSGADADSKNDCGQRALEAARNNLEAARVFKLRGFDGWTPLMVLVEQEKEADVAEVLQTAGADLHVLLNERKNDGKSCLHVAAAMPSSPAQQRILKSLIEARADMNAKDCAGLTPLDVSGRGETSDLLKAHGAEGWTELMMAAEKGDLDCLRALVVSQADPNAKQINQMTALHVAAGGWSVECVSYLVSVRADVNAVFSSRDRFGCEKQLSALDVAKRDRVVRVLWEAGAGGLTALMLAADDHDTARIRELVDQGADPNAQAHDGSTALHLAVRKGIDFTSQRGRNQRLQHLQTAKALLESRTDPNLKDQEGNSAYDLRGRFSSFTPEMDALFRTWGADGWTPLMIASEKGDIEQLSTLLAQGADPNVQNKRGYAALHHSSTVPVVNALLDAKAIIDLQAKEAGRFMLDGKVPVETVTGEDVKDALRSRGASGWTRLMVEARNANVDAVQQLLSSKADVNATDRGGESAVFKAAALPYDQRVKETLEALIHAKANLEDRTRIAWTTLDVAKDEGVRDLLMSLGVGGWTPLMVAALKGDAEKVMGCQSDPDAFNVKRMTALHIAVSQPTEYSDVVKALLAARASPGMKSLGDRTALHLAAERGHSASVKLLVDSRADLEAKDLGGKTPLFAAVENNRLDAVLALVEAGADVSLRDNYGRFPTPNDHRNAQGKEISAVLHRKQIENLGPLTNDGKVEEGDDGKIWAII